jgi:molybdopterin converting factor subunit 1
VRVKLLYFGVMRDWFEVSDETLELMDGATVGGLLDLLRPRTPGDDRLWRSLAVAVNREYSSPGLVLRDGDEVALLPPVSGGCGARVYQSAVHWEAALHAELALLANDSCGTSHQSGPIC